MSDLVNVPTLNSDNYLEWRDLIMSLLEMKDCDDVLINLDEDIEGTEREIAKKKKLVRGYLITSINRANRSIIAHLKEPREIWKAIERHHTSKIRAAKIRIQKQYSSLKMDGTLEDYIIKFHDCMAKLKMVDVNLPEEDYAIKFLEGLPKKYKLSVKILLNKSEGLNLEEVINIISEEDKEVEDTEYAMNAKVKNFPTNTRSRGTAKIKCFYCGRLGHKANECRNKKADREKGIFKKNKYGPANTTDNNFEKYHREFKTEQINKATLFMTQVDQPYIDQNMWILDSGCSKHMTPYLGKLTNIKKANTDIMLANKSIIKSDTSGDIEGILTEDKNEIKISNVLYVPELNTNLLSVMELQDKGLDILFRKNKCEIKKGNRVIVQGNKVSGIYCVKLSTIEKCNMLTNATESETLWHYRMGHLNYNSLNQLKNEQMATGIDFKNEKKPFL